MLDLSGDQIPSWSYLRAYQESPHYNKKLSYHPYHSGNFKDFRSKERSFWYCKHISFIGCLYHLTRQLVIYKPGAQEEIRGQIQILSLPLTSFCDCEQALNLSLSFFISKMQIITILQGSIKIREHIKRPFNQQICIESLLHARNYSRVWR